MLSRDINRPQADSLLSTIGTFSGVASLLLAVAGNNLEKLSLLQRWGLAGASAVMLWAFLAGVIAKQFIAHMKSFDKLKAFCVLLIGGLVGAGLLLAAIPLFSFGLPASSTDTLSLWAAGIFLCVFMIGAFGFLFAEP